MGQNHQGVRKVIACISIFIFSFSFIAGGPAFADERDQTIGALLERISALEKKVEDLNKKLEVETSLGVAKISEEFVEKKVQAELDKRKESIAKTICQLKDVTLAGFVDTSYTYNFAGPDSRTNTARVFDTEANNFNVQAAELVFEKLPPDEGGVGFRTDLFFGEDAQIITPAGSTSDEFDLQQAYISLRPPPAVNLPFGSWKWIKIGKFVTMHGAEVIEAKDNWNFTRSLLFGYAIPFTHTGIRAGYQLFDGIEGYLGINNGWDNVKDNNKTKSVEWALFTALNDKLTLNLAGMYGPEQTSNDHSQRGLVDFLMSYKPLKKWTFMVNADYAHEKDAVSADKDGSWSGVAGYIKYDPYDWMSLISRTEFFSDRQGLRVTSGTAQDLWETTLTLEIRPYKELITRLEYRHDESSSKIFSRNQKSIDHQDTLGLEAIYVF